MSAKLPDGNALTSTHLAANFFCDYQHGDIKVIPTLPNAVGNFINLADLPQKLVAQGVVLFIRRCVQDAAPKTLFTFVSSQLLHNSDRIGDQLSSVCLNRHQLCYVCLFVNRPVLIKLLKQSLDLCPLAQELLRRQLAELLGHCCLRSYDREMQLRDFLLQLLKGLIHHVTLLEYHLRELVLLTIDP